MLPSCWLSCCLHVFACALRAVACLSPPACLCFFLARLFRHSCGIRLRASPADGARTNDWCQRFSRTARGSTKNWRGLTVRADLQPHPSTDCEDAHHGEQYTHMYACKQRVALRMLRHAQLVALAAQRDLSARKIIRVSRITMHQKLHIAVLQALASRQMSEQRACVVIIFRNYAGTLKLTSICFTPHRCIDWCDDGGNSGSPLKNFHESFQRQQS